MKKFTSLLLIISMIYFQSNFAFSVSADSAAAAILMNADTQEVLYEKNAYDEKLVASTTKIMTALIVLENCEIDELVLIKPEYTGIEGSSMYLETGRIYTVEDLLYGLLLASGNDAATALAYHTAGGIDEFAELMNEKVEELGLENTQFKNPHGLDAEGHYSSAYDLAVIMSEALKNHDFLRINSTESITIGEQTFTNHNKILTTYEGSIGGKTGYTKAAGRSLVSAARRDNLTLICVTISDPDDWNTHKTLFDWGFENFVAQEIVLPMEVLEIPLISGVTETVEVGLTEKVYISLPKGERAEGKIELPMFLFAPVNEGDIVGKVTIYNNEKIIGEEDIVALENGKVNEEIRLNLWERVKMSLYRFSGFSIFLP